MTTQNLNQIWKCDKKHNKISWVKDKWPASLRTLKQWAGFFFMIELKERIFFLSFWFLEQISSKAHCINYSLLKQFSFFLFLWTGFLEVAADFVFKHVFSTVPNGNAYIFIELNE